MQLNVIIHEAEEGGFWAEVPALKGCFSQGETYDEILMNIREAIILFLSDDNLSEYELQNAVVDKVFV